MSGPMDVCERVLALVDPGVEAEVTVVLISVSGKPLRISSALREAFGE